MAPNYITLLGLDHLTREIQWLEKEERPRIVAEVAYAASLGDRSDNAEYRYGKARLRKIDSRRRYLMGRFEKARPVDTGKLSGTVVNFGATVVLADEEGEEKTWKIYGEDEVDVARGILSWRSPIAQAIMGKEAGDAVSFRAPGGVREIEIVEVRYEAQPDPPEEIEFRL